MLSAHPNSFLLFKQINMNTTAIHVVLFILFFVSGGAALIYQVMWERMLFSFFGVDLQSITMIVSVLMVGLGTGGIIGGFIF